MVRLIYSVRRPAGVRFEDLHEHWRDHHVEVYGQPLTALRRYVLYRGMREQPTAANQPYDGLVSVWYTDMDALNATMGSVLDAAVEDERLFIDHSRSRAVIVDDRIVVEPDHPSPVVAFQWVARRPDVDQASFAEAWRAAGEAAKADYRPDGLQGYIQSVVRPAEAGDNEDYEALFDAEVERWDGISAAYFQSSLLARRYLERTPTLPGNDTAEIDPERTVTTLVRRIELRSPVR